jgi:SAM-dependent methyltransferase
MKVRESGMPDESLWGKFFDVPQILQSMEIDRSVNDVAEFGCGYGTFTIPTASTISGKLYGIDIEPDLVSKVIDEGVAAGLSNIVAITRDFIKDGTGLDDGSVDYVMLFNILHAERPLLILKEAHRVLRPNGKLGIIHWNYDSSTPRGPPMPIRPKPEECIEWAKRSGFRFMKRVDLKPYHYGLVFQSPKMVNKKAGPVMEWPI